ncbi:MAG: hypothetical protein CM1200mP25_1780 [Acidobacteriota bacterium]|nr:MAG: hypothetical protein CM1200mP25_1780 [Acidobacteriota bacterium]
MSTLQPPSEIRDVVVIGSGAGGATVAHVFTKPRYSVTFLKRANVGPIQEFKEHNLGPIVTTPGRRRR